LGDGLEKGILITGNMGYIGPVVVSELRALYPSAYICGLDTGFFAHCLTPPTRIPEIQLNKQYFQDIRSVEPEIFTGIDTVIHLAAISNDPIGNAFSGPTEDINYFSSVSFAKAAKNARVKNFIFASSCSIYGAGGDEPKTENDKLDPLTTYAHSKVNLERELQKISDESFKVTCLRFATACGWTKRTRFDLVLNDFVLMAVKNNRIQVLSDGSPWRPLIHVKDMAAALIWAISREDKDSFLAINAGRNDCNFQIRDLANLVAKMILNTEVQIARNAAPDKRSYRVDFSLFERMAPSNTLKFSIEDAILDLYENIKKINSDTLGLGSVLSYTRLVELKKLKENGLLDSSLLWAR